ncbi:hypothetical protein ACFXNW_24325 [Nocardia sp. NPDC059180]|uniref:hypothetical protein n=1 Tax=Nocardia sp. NPDC059180 TaxID=3346761 RepID=UPI0036C9A9BE
MESILRFRSQTFINFRDFEFESSSTHGFRWVDLKEFELLDAAASPPDILKSLIGEDAFRDDYSGGGIDPVGDRHGPYWLSMVRPSSYEPVDVQGAIEVLSKWYLQYGNVPSALREDLERIVDGPIRSSDSCFLLRELGDSAVHDYGRIQIDFHEVVAMRAGLRSVRLIVAADD